MLYDQFIDETTQQPPMALDIKTTSVVLPTPVPVRPKALANPPTQLKREYFDYGENEDGLTGVMDEMIALERVPNRRDSDYDAPSSPIEKLQREEHQVRDAVPAMWAGEQDISHHVDVAAHRRPRRSSSLLHVAQPSVEELATTNSQLRYDPIWPLSTLSHCPACKAALKWQSVTEQHKPSPCLCESSSAPVHPGRRNAAGDDDNMARMSSYVEEHLAWPLEL